MYGRALPIFLDQRQGLLYCFLREAVHIEAKAMAHKGKRLEAIGYMRTSSATNVGASKDSDKRQRAAIEGYAKAAGFVIVDWYYDAAVRGSDAITERPGFAAMLQRIASNGVRTIIVESPDRFARDLAVQLAGHDHLRRLGVTLVPATAPDFFIEDTPTAVLVRQVLGAIAQFDKATTVAKLKAARDRIRQDTGKCGGRKSYAERDPKLVELAKQLRHPNTDARPVSLRQVAADLKEHGYVTPSGEMYSASAVASMIGFGINRYGKRS
jgi:DNA invertase Pin-like site-specific DNA recombinase